MNRIVSFLAAATCLVQSGPGAKAPHITAGANVRVSADRGAQYHGELWACADPGNAKRLLLTSMIYDAEHGQDHSVVYSSQDGGGTWKATLETGMSSDPACAFGPDGTALFTHLNMTANTLETYRSRDGGTNWTPPTLTKPVDREYVTADDSASSHRGNVYLYAHDSRDPGQRSREFVLWTSRDGGASFGPAAFPRPTVGAVPGNGVVLSDGTFVEVSNVVIPSASRGKTEGSRVVAVFLSRDGGDHVSGPIAVSEEVPPATGGKGSATVTALPFLAVDKSRGPHRDRLYVVWPDGRAGRSQIMLSYSSDKGETWSAPKAIDDPPSSSDRPRGPDSSMPAVGVNKDGIVGVSWYDRREASDNRAWRCRFSASLDGGEAFLPSIAVAEAMYLPEENHVPPTPPEILATLTRPSFSQAVFRYTGGDTAGLSVDAAGIFHVFWTDTRTGIAQIWTSAVRVDVL